MFAKRQTPSSPLFYSLNILKILKTEDLCKFEIIKFIFKLKNYISHIYKIPCKDCSGVYIGETGRCFNTCLSEDKHNLKPIRVTKFSLRNILCPLLYLLKFNLPLIVPEEIMNLKL